MKFDFELDIYEKVDPIYLVINKDVRFTTVTFYRLYYLLFIHKLLFQCTILSSTYSSKMDFNHKQISSVCPIQF